MRSLPVKTDRGGEATLYKVKTLVIAPESLISLFKNTAPVTLSFAGIPQDAEITSVYVSREYGQIEINITSEEFPLHNDHEEREKISLIVTQHRPTQV